MNVLDFDYRVLRHGPLIAKIELLRHRVTIVGVHQAPCCPIDKLRERRRDRWIGVHAVAPVAECDASSRDFITRRGYGEQALIN